MKWTKELKYNILFGLLLVLIGETWDISVGMVFSSSYDVWNEISLGGILFFLTFNIAYFTVYAINYLVFAPRFLKLNKIPQYILAFVFMVLCFAAVRFFLEEILSYHLFGAHNYNLNRSNIVAIYLTDSAGYALRPCLFSSLAYLFFRYKEKTQQVHELKTQHQEAQMAMLRSQIGPHFLFNTLNTIYLNALKKDDKTPDLILKLSDSFRYILHEGQKEKVAIQQELFHIQNYIHLQEERLSDKVQVNFIKNIENQTQEIAPILLIGFIENAFKYVSILKGNNHKIDIEILLKNKELRFFCKNPFNKNALDRISVDWIESGIGIRNTEKRLQLLYPQNHTLEINEDTDFFEIKLTLKL